MKTLLILDSLPEAASEAPPPPPQQDWRQLEGIVNNSLPDVLKSNTVTRFKIIFSLRNNLQNHRRIVRIFSSRAEKGTFFGRVAENVRLPVYRNKQFEEGEVFHRSKPKLYFFIFSITRQQKLLKLISANTESRELI
jgi:hypothetical protein